MAIYSKTYIVGNSDPEGLHERPSCAIWKLCIDAEDSYGASIDLINKDKNLFSKVKQVWDVIGIYGAPGDRIKINVDYEEPLKNSLIKIVEDIGKVLTNPKGTFVNDILNQ
ncbi:hypothetical protein K9L16_03710 [Candidatus Pacearchaeota archaeon]|nr:hypothetical protein [Candidatus Pacearchaeota archaeon]